MQHACHSYVKPQQLKKPVPTCAKPATRVITQIVAPEDDAVGAFRDAVQLLVAVHAAAGLQHADQGGRHSFLAGFLLSFQVCSRGRSRQLGRLSGVQSRELLSLLPHLPRKQFSCWIRLLAQWMQGTNP